MNERPGRNASTRKRQLTQPWQNLRVIVKLFAVQQCASHNLLQQINNTTNYLLT